MSGGLVGRGLMFGPFPVRPGLRKAESNETGGEYDERRDRHDAFSALICPNVRRNSCLRGLYRNSCGSHHDPDPGFQDQHPLGDRLLDPVGRNYLRPDAS